MTVPIGKVMAVRVNRAPLTRRQPRLLFARHELIRRRLGRIGTNRSQRNRLFDLPPLALVRHGAHRWFYVSALVEATDGYKPEYVSRKIPLQVAQVHNNTLNAVWTESCKQRSARDLAEPAPSCRLLAAAERPTSSPS
ncbi:uncharacterized protein LY79DRAFT_509259 [Colletotrichum navitas]|uniref:Uncharacterized protein n=1 Tax=Colletotrichum navitas TaxID=681940 RepID=A0AAD8V8A0_9PEZI|nr:uncharacterized protein LY79DRAFT_509259 [Colletotrichum navitas]KAK1596719.1 hypothetical protein LY79DRAFT_509259 [Colletotrichum navitas]